MLAIIILTLIGVIALLIKSSDNKPFGEHTPPKHGGWQPKRDKTRSLSKPPQ